MQDVKAQNAISQGKFFGDGEGEAVTNKFLENDLKLENYRETKGFRKITESQQGLEGTSRDRVQPPAKAGFLDQVAKVVIQASFCYICLSYAVLQELQVSLELLNNF